MTFQPITRRGFMSTSLASGILAGSTALAQAGKFSEGGDYTYEVTRTDPEWKERLTQEEYEILRTGSTETPKSSPLWEETRNGSYACKGCDLHNYDANWKVILDKGWAFFHHSTPNSVLTGIDGPVPDYGSDMAPEGTVAMMEAHCRRCGSHLGHIVMAEGMLLHCINGASLNFAPTEA